MQLFPVIQPPHLCFVDGDVLDFLYSAWLSTHTPSTAGQVRPSFCEAWLLTALRFLPAVGGAATMLAVSSSTSACFHSSISLPARWLRYGRVAAGKVPSQRAGISVGKAVVPVA